jgi:hypothetical protein
LRSTSDPRAPLENNATQPHNCHQANSVFLHKEYLIDVFVAQPKGPIQGSSVFLL